MQVTPEMYLAKAYATRCEELELEAKIDKVWDLAVANYRLAIQKNDGLALLRAQRAYKQLAQLTGQFTVEVEAEVAAWVKLVEGLN
jgi:hypothetical protein